MATEESGQNTLPLGEKPPVDDVAVQQAKLIADLKASNDAAVAKAAKLEAADKKRAEEERRKDSDAESLRKELADRDAKLATLTATVNQRVELLWSKMSDVSQKKFELIRGDLDPLKLIGLIEAEIAATPVVPDEGSNVTKKTLPPPTGSPMPDGHRKGDRYTPTAGGSELLSKLMKRDDTLRGLDVKKDGTTVKFTMDPLRFAEGLKDNTRSARSMRREEELLARRR